jgi:vancomycin resistance protein VanW
MKIHPIKHWVTGHHLKGVIYSDRETPRSYRVFERNHRFLSQNGKNYRENEIWRAQVGRKTGNKIREEPLVKNFAEVKYRLNFAAQACNV